jgi:hypothetical protein
MMCVEHVASYPTQAKLCCLLAPHTPWGYIVSPVGCKAWWEKKFWSQYSQPEEHQWLKPVITETQEAEIGRVMVLISPGKKVCKTPILTESWVVVVSTYNPSYCGQHK